MMPRTTSATARLSKRLREHRGVTLVGLLVIIAIMSIVSTMIMLGWSAASQSIDYSADSAMARDEARYAVGRMTREIRDARLPSVAYIADAGLASTTPAIVRARQTWIALFSFNVAGAMPTTGPRLVVYCLYPDGTLWRFVDANRNGRNDGASGAPKWASSLTAMANGTGSQGSEATQTSTWEGASLIVNHVVNQMRGLNLYDYSAYDTIGWLGQNSPVLGDAARSNIVAVEIRLLEDLNPGHSPAYMDLQTSAQLRNAH